MRAVVVQSGSFVLADVPKPVASPDACIVRVQAVSLNRGEVRRALGGGDGMRIGWDVAGEVEVAAADGTGPQPGTRVVGFLPACDGWAERAAVSTRYLAPVPDGVSSEVAATLPVAGLTALYGLERGERLLGSRVLVTGATGGVGLFACQLAAKMGAVVVAQVRRDDQVKLARSAHAAEVVVDPEGTTLAQHGPYRLIFDGVGGAVLGSAATVLLPSGRAVLYGVTGNGAATISLGAMLGTGDGALQGFNLYHEARRVPPSDGLARLLAMVAADELDPFIQRRASWSEAGVVAQALIDRKFHGKAVLSVD